MAIGGELVTDRGAQNSIVLDQQNAHVVPCFPACGSLAS
jgi:hypothetical protein